MKNQMRFQNKQQQPLLRFSPTAWAKLIFMRDVTNDEVGGFGIAKHDDLLFVTDFALVKQKVSCASVAFEDESVADFFEDQVAAGRKPEEFARIWLHTHPGSFPEPSITDEETFARVFGSCDWSVMCIVAQDGKTFARLRFNTGPGGEVKIPVCVDYTYEFDATDFGLWHQQYKANVREMELSIKRDKPNLAEGCELKQDSEQAFSQKSDGLPLLSAEELLTEIEQMHPIERDTFLDELAVRSNFWEEEMEARYEY